MQNSKTVAQTIPGETAHFGLFPPKIGFFRGVGGVPNFFFLWESYFLCYLGAHAKMCNPMISLSGIYFKIAHFPVKIGLIGGVGGVTEIWFSLESSYFCYLGAHAKIQNPNCLLSGRKATTSEERGARLYGEERGYMA